MTPGTNFNKINWLKAGILACDKLLTVSPNYATEISSGPQLGVELDKWVRVSASTCCASLLFVALVHYGGFQLDCRWHLLACWSCWRGCRQLDALGLGLPVYGIENWLAMSNSA